MNFITRSKDVFHVCIVELVPVTRSSNKLLISWLTAGCLGRESKYRVVISEIKCCRSRAYPNLDALSWYASFQICHLFSTRCISRLHRFVTHVCADLNFGRGSSLSDACCKMYWYCAYFHFIESRPRKRCCQPICSCSLNTSVIASEILSDLSHTSVGVPPVRNVRTKQIRIFQRSR